MGSIEEDIKILENLIVTLPNFHLGGSESIRNILQDYKRQKQINEEHQKINGELREKVKELEKESKILEFQNKQIENYAEELKKYNKTVSDRIVEYKKNSIPKQVVIDKIEELKLSGGSDGKDNVENLVRELTIDILQELLETK